MSSFVQERSTVDLAADFRGIVVEQPDDPPLATRRQVFQQRNGSIARAKYDDRLPVERAEFTNTAILPCTIGQPAATHEKQQQQRVQEIHRSRYHESRLPASALPGWKSSRPCGGQDQP
jgi:hypothetical protein